MSTVRGFEKSNRLSKWMNLLGITDSKETSHFEGLAEEELAKNMKMRVITQDVLRTRSDEPFFKNGFLKAVMKQTLIRFCSFHRIEYMQGLNEILAPILTLQEDILLEVEKGVFSLEPHNIECWDQVTKYIEHPFGLNLLIFERLMALLSPTTFSTRGVDAIQVQLTSFHLILMYHEPVLAIILRKEGMTPDIYAMSWLITLFARRQPVHRALHIWDLLLQIDSPYICVFLAVALIRSRKGAILNNSADMLPETLVSLKFESDEEIDAVFADALLLQRSTPSHIKEELKVLGFNAFIEESVREEGLKELWFQPCVTVDALEVARSLSLQSEVSTEQHGHRYLVLDCRHSVELQLLDALYIEGSVSVPRFIQEEICSLARHKSALLDREEMDLGNASSSADPCEIERAFARAIGQLSTKTAAVLSLLWAAFVSSATESVHFVIASDSTGPYQYTGADARSPLNTSYALPYHTACAISDQAYRRERTSSEHLAENLPQYITHSSNTACNHFTVSFASALIILGFPRVSIIHPEDLQLVGAGVEAQFTCTESNSLSSLPVQASELRSSGFACLVHHLGACGVPPVVISAKYSHLQTPIDHFKEYQVCAFAHELRSTAITFGTIDPNFYSGYHESHESLAVSGLTSASPRTSVTTPAGKPSQVSIVAAILTSPSPTTAPAKAVLGLTEPTTTAASSGALSSLGSALSVLSTGSSPRNANRTPRASNGKVDVLIRDESGLLSTAAVQGPVRTAVLRETARSSSENGNARVATCSGQAVMAAKLDCSLDVLYNLLLIMSAQKKQHIVRLVTTSCFHSCVPALNSSASPIDLPPLTPDTGSASTGRADYTYLLGPSPIPCHQSAICRVNAEYYRKLEMLLALRDTLHELVNTQRLNTVVDKTSNKANTKIRLLKNAMDQTARQAGRARTGLYKRITLRATQQRHAQEAAAAVAAGRKGYAGEEEGDEVWQTTQDLVSYFRDDAQNDSRSSSVLRDSSISVDYWDQQHTLHLQGRGSRFSSVDSIGLNVSDLL